MGEIDQNESSSTKQRFDQIDGQIDLVTKTFLGLSVSCARCHDHKFDPVSQEDYYALQAVFAGVSHAERRIPLIEAEQVVARSQQDDSRPINGHHEARRAFLKTAEIDPAAAKVHLNLSGSPAPCIGVEIS